MKIQEDIKVLDLKEELTQSSEDEKLRRLKLKEEFCRKLREEIRRKQRSHCKWLNEGVTKIQNLSMDGVGQAKGE